MIVQQIDTHGQGERVKILGARLTGLPILDRPALLLLSDKMVLMLMLHNFMFIITLDKMSLFEEKFKYCP